MSDPGQDHMEDIIKDQKQIDFSRDLNIIKQVCDQFKGSLQEHQAIQAALNKITQFCSVQTIPNIPIKEKVENKKGG